MYYVLSKYDSSIFSEISALAFVDSLLGKFKLGISWFSSFVTLFLFIVH